MAARLRQVFPEDKAKMHESEHKFNVRKYKIQRLDESYRLVTIVLEKNNHSRKTQNIFLTTIAATVTFFISHHRAAAATIQPWWSSLCRTHIKNIISWKYISILPKYLSRYEKNEMKSSSNLLCIFATSTHRFNKHRTFRYR
jgi:hypothetical protein